MYDSEIKLIVNGFIVIIYGERIIVIVIFKFFSSNRNFSWLFLIGSSWII